MQFGFAFSSCFASLNNLLAVSAGKRSDSEMLAVPCVLQVDILHGEMEKQRCEMSIVLAKKYNRLKSNTACNNGLSCFLTEESSKYIYVKSVEGEEGKLITKS